MNFKVEISVCRVCMKSENGVSLFKDRDLLDKFIYTTKLKVKENDSMPSILCGRCTARLKIAHEFCRLANSSEKHLRKFISKISTDFQEVTKTIPEDDDDCLNENDSDINALIDEAGGFGQIDNNFRHPKVESEGLADELEIIEIPDEAITKQEVFENEIYMEEFHEIIQEDNCDTNLYLDENSEEIHLYEDTNELFEEEGSVQEEKSNAGEQQDAISGFDAADEKESQNTEKKTGRKKMQRSVKKLGMGQAVKLEGKSNICIKCNKDFSTKTNLMRHMTTHDGVKPYQCNVCGKGFTQNGSLKQHMFIHTGERPHVCTVCQRGFTQSKSLIFHMRRHTGEKPFACTECGISFRQKDGLKHHIIKYHSGTPANPDRHVCCVCDRILSSKYSLSVHMKKHTKDDDKKSDTDIEADSSLTNTKEVLNSSQLSPAQSPGLPTSTQAERSDAGARFGTINLLTAGNAGAGLRMKQYQCGKCFKSFHIKRNLLRHLRNHDVSSLDLHECEECKIGFDTKRSLKLHRQRDHKDVIPDLNNCDICSVSYSTLANLNEHIASVHDPIEQDCPHCNEHFISQKVYYDHLLEHEHMLED